MLLLERSVAVLLKFKDAVIVAVVAVLDLAVVVDLQGLFMEFMINMSIKL